ncbi:MAG: hypothetical protein V4543_01650 [Bacteroidota bacterium]
MASAGEQNTTRGNRGQKPAKPPVKLNLKQVLVLALAVSLFLIGLHQSVTVGLGQSYWLFMFAIAALLWARLLIMGGGKK